jgi:eukaryotic-like serine/threonine-protein kinase
MPPRRKAKGASKKAPAKQKVEPLSVPPPDELIDGRYRIIGTLGAGGMGTVMIAEHAELRRRVALKVLQEQVGADPAMRKRFKREARTLAAMSHPNIVALNDYGIWNGAPYLVMELLEGRTMRDLLDKERVLPEARAIAIAQQVLRALGYAQAQAVIHRDLKPGNVFLQALPDHVDHVKLLDFGFAKFVDGPHTSLVTGDGILVGTPGYMAPEQATGANVDHRADVYAAGVLLFEMLAGRKPFVGSQIEMIRKRLAEDAPRLSAVRTDHQFSKELEDVVARALARHVSERYQSANEFSAALASARITPASEPEPSIPEISISLSSMELSGKDLVAEEAEEPPPRADTAPARSYGPWLALVAALVIAGGAWYGWPLLHRGEPPREIAPRASDRAREPEPAPIEERAPEPIAEPDAPPPEAPQIPATPWAGEIAPELDTLRARIDRTPIPTDAELRTVALYARNHPDEVLPILLLARGYMKSGWLTGAFERYSRAYEMDPESRGDPQMLSDLLVLSVSPTLGARATDLVANAYGAEALASIDAALAREEVDAHTDARLRELRQRIAGGAP